MDIGFTFGCMFLFSLEKQPLFTDSVTKYVQTY